MVTTEFTYGKVTAAASRRGYQLIQLPMPPDADGRFRLDLDLLDETLLRRPGWVYIVSPNNPTGQVIVEPTDLRRIVVGHRDSTFWIDEAYEGYLAPGRERATSLVAGLDNVFVSRSLSFAHGLAGLRIGYVIGPSSAVGRFRDRQTPWQFGALQQEAAIAALNDNAHLAAQREAVEMEFSQMARFFDGMSGMEYFPTNTNFMLCRLTDGRKSESLAARAAADGFKLKLLEEAPGYDHSAYFRLPLDPRHGERVRNVLKAFLG